MTRERAGSMVRTVVVALMSALSVGCATQDIPQAHRGRVFGRTGLWAGYKGPVGFHGSVLDPGTHFLGLYDELRMIDCSMHTMTESLDTMTHDGVHFGFTISVRFNVDCSDASVPVLMTKLAPDREHTISAQQVYATFVNPAIKEAAREFISPYRANELNDKQAEVVSGVRKRFLEIMETRERAVVQVHEVNVGELKFPEQMDHANLERAVQSVLRDKAVAERERIGAEVEAMEARKKLVEKEADLVAERIERIGAALRKFPEYLQFHFVDRLREFQGNLVLGGSGAPVLTPLLAPTVRPPAAGQTARPAAPSPTAGPTGKRGAEK